MGIQLFRFHTDFGAWYYTNARSQVLATVPDITGGGSTQQTFTSEPMKKREWNRTIGDAKYEITLKSANVFVAQYHGGVNPGGLAWMTVWQVKGGMSPPYVAADLVLQFMGKLRRIGFDFKAQTAKCEATALGNILSSDIPRRVYNPRCDFNLFDSDCGLVKATFKFTESVASTGYAIGDITITGTGIGAESTAQTGSADGWFSGGFVECVGGSGTSKHMIAHQIGNSVTLLSPFQELTGADFDFYPGCIKTSVVCNAPFGNLARFGGFQHIPEKNPVIYGF